MSSNARLFTSESVTEGHPDKVCDQISDAILDAMLEQDPSARVAVETMVTTGLVHVAGEVTTEAYVEIPAVVRDTILGERSAAGGRPGRAFPENGTIVTEVEVLSADIVDPKIGDLMLRVQSEFVQLQIGDRQAEEALASARLRADLERQRMELAAAAKEREAKLAELARKLAHEAALFKLKDEEALAAERQALADTREGAALAARLDRAVKANDANRAEQQKDRLHAFGPHHREQAAEHRI